MMRKYANRKNINLSGCDVITGISFMDHHRMLEISTIIILKDNEYYTIHDETDKICDIAKMPNYITDDWINYNKIPLKESIVDEFIERFSKIDNIESQELSQILRGIKRELSLKKIL